MGSWHVRSKKKEENDVKAFNAHQLPSCHISLTFFLNPFSFIFSYIVFFNVRIITAKRMAAHFSGFSQWYIWLTHFVHYLSTLTRIQVCLGQVVRFQTWSYPFFCVLFLSDVSNHQSNDNLIWRISGCLSLGWLQT